MSTAPPCCAARGRASKIGSTSAIRLKIGLEIAVHHGQAGRTPLPCLGDQLGLSRGRCNACSGAHDLPIDLGKSYSGGLPADLVSARKPVRAQSLPKTAIVMHKRNLSGKRFDIADLMDE